MRIQRIALSSIGLLLMSVCGLYQCSGCAAVGMHKGEEFGSYYPECAAFDPWFSDEGISGYIDRNGICLADKCVYYTGLLDGPPVIYRASKGNKAEVLATMPGVPACPIVSEDGSFLYVQRLREEGDTAWFPGWVVCTETGRIQSISGLPPGEPCGYFGGSKGDVYLLTSDAALATDSAQWEGRLWQVSSDGKAKYLATCYAPAPHRFERFDSRTMQWYHVTAEGDNSTLKGAMTYYVVTRRSVDRRSIIAVEKSGPRASEELLSWRQYAAGRYLLTVNRLTFHYATLANTSIRYVNLEFPRGFSK